MMCFILELWGLQWEVDLGYTLFGCLYHKSKAQLYGHAIEVMSEIVRDHIKNLKNQAVSILMFPIPKRRYPRLCDHTTRQKSNPGLSNGISMLMVMRFIWVGPPPPAEDNQKGTDFNAIENNFGVKHPLTK
ncbi:MAG: hypothetical protein Ct9H300mP6_05280 [Gammaproteobacteria bacterium]|nr:MAG: hypothetical protein Ct9H300mP6_05280 [Gammaproteobacteria bacterium]